MTSGEIQERIESERMLRKDRLEAGMAMFDIAAHKQLLATLECAYQTALLSERLSEIRFTGNGSLFVKEMEY